MQPPAFLALHGGADDEFGDHHQVAQLQQVVADVIVAVVLGDFVSQQLGPVQGPLQAFFRAHDTDVIPHEAAQFIPVMADHHVLVGIGDLGFIPFLVLAGFRHVGQGGADMFG